MRAHLFNLNKYQQTGPYEMKLGRRLFYIVCVLLLIQWTIYRYRYQEEGDYDLEWPLSIHRINNSFEVALNFDLMPVDKVPGKFTILDDLILREGARGKQLTFEDLLNIPDYQWNWIFDRRVALLYPQAYNLSIIIRRLREREAVPEVSVL